MRLTRNNSNGNTPISFATYAAAAGVVLSATFTAGFTSGGDGGFTFAPTAASFAFAVLASNTLHATNHTTSQPYKPAQ